MRRELAPTPEQAIGLRQGVGACRFAQNAILTRVKSAIDSGEKLSWSSISLHTEWRRIRSEVAPWFGEVSKEAFQDGCARASNALLNWHGSKTGRRKGKTGFPKFRKRGSRDSWTFTAGQLHDQEVRIPRVGRVRLKERVELAAGSRITAYTVRSEAGRWFVTFRIREQGWEPPAKKTGNDVVGIDLGIGENFAVLSDGTKVTNPRFFREDENKIRRASRAVSRRQKGSSNRRKAVARLGRTHYQVRNRRQDFLHKFTTDLVKSHDRIVIEDLNVAGMGKKKGYKLGKSVADAALQETRRQIEYKCLWYGTELMIADRWFASSKLCSECGTINSGLQLSDREWVCLGCGITHDRDVNAAVNLRNLAGSSPVTACGEDVRPGLVPADLGEAGRSVVGTDDDRL